MIYRALHNIGPCLKIIEIYATHENLTGHCLKISSNKLSFH